MSEARLQANASIGSAVLACQGLEMLFALCVRLAFKQKDAATLADVTPLEKNFSKPSTKCLLTELRKFVDVSDEFEITLSDLIERRHILIHRWAIEHGLPNDGEAFQRIEAFANTLASDATNLSRILLGYMVHWLRNFPEFQVQLSEDKTLMAYAVPDELKNLRIERPNKSLEQTRER